MTFFRKIKAGLVKDDIARFVGEEGNIFFNVETGELRLSDGITPGGIPISSGASSGKIVVEQNSEEKGTVSRLNFTNSTITIDDDTANITVQVSESIKEVSTVDQDNTALNIVSSPDAIRFDDAMFTVNALPDGSAKVGINTGGYKFPRPRFHGFNRVDDELIYTVVDSGEVRLVDGDGNELYSSFDIGNNQYEYAIINGELVLKFLTE
jgi:hypothetical protein